MQATSSTTFVPPCQAAGDDVSKEDLKRMYAKSLEVIEQQRVQLNTLKQTVADQAASFNHTVHNITNRQLETEKKVERSFWQVMKARTMTFFTMGFAAIGVIGTVWNSGIPQAVARVVVNGVNSVRRAVV